ncbi:hypothetical protein [Streptomyces sp. x-80]|uniref:hypothetical protein n=1 Tax=Streptomyces sp. x-80 TaxID=2789282 RepID=UPI00397FF55B
MADEPVEFVSEYRVPGPRRGDTGGEFVAARAPEDLNQRAVFEGSVHGRHWDGSTWQHARFTGTDPYLFSRANALVTARQHAGADHDDAAGGARA